MATYTEIFEGMYHPDGQTMVSGLAPEEQAAWRLFEYLSTRGGFDGWWCNLKEDIQDEIFAEVKQLILGNDPYRTRTGKDIYD